MRVIPADDFETVKSKYIEIIEKTPGIKEYARWVYGQHPTDVSLKSYVDNGEMYCLMDDETIAGMVAIVMHQDQEYKWGYTAKEYESFTYIITDANGDKTGRPMIFLAKIQ